MRLIATSHDEKRAQKFSAFLSKEGIDNQLDVQKGSDWGSEEYGQLQYRIWIFNEDEVDRAKKFWEEFEENPEDEKFAVERKPIKDILPKKTPETPTMGPPLKAPFLRRKSTGTLSVYLIIFCSLLFITMEMGATWVKKVPKYIPYTVINSSQLKKDMLFDYPANLDIADNLVLLYGVDALMEPENLPPEGQLLIKEYLQTPYWKGVYHEVVAGSNGDTFQWLYDGPLFEKIHQGEVWRLFTPALLHGDLFHLLFNMIWLAILGTQMEIRMGKVRYLLFVVIAAVISNVAQYLMSGYNFLGYSGVVCGMLTFIWIRQKRAPWEGYRLHPSTVAFITFFVLAMMALQVVSFLLEVYQGTTLPIGIANTAHITGGLVGLFLGRFDLLVKKKS